MRDTAQVKAAGRARLAVFSAVSCAMLACGEQVLVARIASETESLQSDAADLGDAVDASGPPTRAEMSRDAAVDSGSKNDSKHDDDSDDHDKDDKDGKDGN